MPRAGPVELTLAATVGRQRETPWDKPIASSDRAKNRRVATNVRLHGTSPWHRENLVLYGEADPRNVSHNYLLRCKAQCLTLTIRVSMIEANANQPDFNW